MAVATREESGREMRGRLTRSSICEMGDGGIFREKIAQKRNFKVLCSHVAEVGLKPSVLPFDSLL